MGDGKMKRLNLRVDTLGCEADETVVLDDLLAHDGVIAAEIDLATETLAVSYDERRTTKSALLDHLRFFGIAPLGDSLIRAA
jgi:copper chaperone CopZ